MYAVFKAVRLSISNNNAHIYVILAYGRIYERSIPFRPGRPMIDRPMARTPPNNSTNIL